MTGHKKMIRERLFVEGVKAIRASGIEEDYYACPICLTCFQREHFNSLTIEHAPQRSSGGKPILLTCRTCNSFAGHTYEADLAAEARLKIKAVTLYGKAQGSAGNVVLSLGDGASVNAVLSGEPGLVCFKIGDNNNPKNVAEFETRLRQNRPDEMNVSISERVRQERVDLADLKSAYLIVVAKVGYAYATTQSSQYVREAITSADTDFPVWKIEKVALEADTALLDQEHGLLVVKIRGNGVVLPWIDTDQEHYHRLCRVKPEISLRGPVFQFPTSFVAEIDNKGNNRLSLLKRHDLDAEGKA